MRVAATNFLGALGLGLLLLTACSRGDSIDDEPGAGGGGGASGGGGAAGEAGSAGAAGASGEGGGGAAGTVNLGGQGGSNDPSTCEGAASLKSYVGCDYWPTVTANVVWSVFDFTVVVVNAGTEPAEVSVTRKDKTVATVTVAPDSVEKIFLDWVQVLKGNEYDSCGVFYPSTESVGVIGGAYHLVSTRPVSVYQFNALEYSDKGGAPGKDWSSCPGNVACEQEGPYKGQKLGCYSFTNDASLLLPTTALTGNYRVSAPRSFPNTPTVGGVGSFFTITGTEDGTKVKVQLSSTAQTLAGDGIAARTAGQTGSFTLNRGDVLQLMGPPGSELSGSQVQADRPIQVIAGNPCNAMPEQLSGRCDHLEQTMPPAEALGRHYVLAPATGPNLDAPGQVVRLLGNVDGTKLTYKGTKPAGAPDVIDAGQLVDLGQLADGGLVKEPFEIEGDHEFLVTMFAPSGTISDPQGQKGDPSMSVSVAVEQFRDRYVFLAPDDYDINVADVIAPAGTAVTLDGEPAAGEPAPIAGTDFVVHRLTLGAGKGGAHILEADRPVGLQVMGYGAATSYQYPGGANLAPIAPPPPPIID